jgi:hypothetical protein
MVKSYWFGGFVVALAAGLILAAENAAPKPASVERPVMSGKNMKSKLGVLYLIGGPESEGLLELCDRGRMPMVKVGPQDITRSEDAARRRAQGKDVGKDLGNFESRALRLKKHNSKAIVVVSVAGNAKLMSLANDPVQAAEKRFKGLEPQLKKLEPHRDQIDFLEAWPNMWEPADVDMARWYCKFTEVLARRIAEAGYRPVILTSGMGGLPIKPEILDAMVPALRVAKKYRGAWACHGYTMDYTMDPEKESFYSLRYRRAYAYLRKAHPDVADLPILLTEGGVDYRGDPDKDGWQARGSVEKYEQWLKWYDGELMKDPQVLGVTLFKTGYGSTWKSFDLEPVTAWLARYLDERNASAAGGGSRSPG